MFGAAIAGNMGTLINRTDVCMRSEK